MYIVSNSFKKILIPVLLCGMLSSCNNSTLQLSNINITQNTKYDSIDVDYTIEDFNNYGFNLGDSVNIKFTNGKEFNDIPYYNGYYVRTGDPLLIGYSSRKYLSFSYKNKGMWTSLGLTEVDKMTISLNQKGKYLQTQEALNQEYSLLRDEYTSDEEFSNFRSIKLSKIKDDLLYRGATPVNNNRNRAKITDQLLQKNGIETIINLCDKQQDFDKCVSLQGFDSNYTLSLYNNNKVILLGLNASYLGDEFKQGVKNGFKFIIENKGKIYIHCMEGKDRTGFVCFLLEAIASSSYQEMLEDYMITYKNYYKVSKQLTPTKYDAIKNIYFRDFIDVVNPSLKDDELENHDFTNDAKSYLLECGLTNEEINQLVTFIKK